MNESPSVTTQHQLLHYQLGASLGEGGFGQVYQAWDTKLQRHVAIKYLKNVMAGVDLTREARLAASLHHPAFVKIHALENTCDGQAIVMELVPGRTLRQILETDPPGISAVLEMVRQVAQAMDEAHRAGLIHGDLKPSNLMQEPGGAVRILDFGLATQADRDATTSIVQADPQGTIAYMAPEILTGASLSASSDIYALGVILYELLMGKRPFAHLSGLALAAAVIQSNSDQWPWNDELPLVLRQLVRALTERQVEHRISSMHTVVQRISELLAVDPVSMQSASLKIELQKLNALALNEEAPLINWRRLAKRWKTWVTISILIVGAYGVWLSWPYLSNVEPTIGRFSAANEMQNGLLALEKFERFDQLEKAEQHFQRILDENAQHAGARAGIALTQAFAFMQERENTKRLEQAEQNANLAMQQGEFVALAHVAKALVLSLQGQDEAAIKQVERAFSLDPKSHFVWYARVRIHLQAGEVDKALAMAQEALRLFPQNSVSLDQLAQLYLQKGSAKTALQLYQTALASSPDKPEIYLGMARLQHQQKLTEPAIELVQQGLKHKPTSELYELLGDLSFARGDYVGAATAFEHAVSRELKHTDDFRVWAKFADTLQWIPGRNDAARAAYLKARDLIQRSLEKDESDIELMSRALLYSAKVGDTKRAEELIRKLDGKIQQRPQALFRLGVSYELMGNRRAALSAIMAAKALSFPVKAIDADPELVSLRRDPIYLGKANP